MSGNQGPQILVEYDNFPPNKTIGPEMKVVIPPLPTQESFSRSSPQEKEGQMRYPQLKSTERFNQFSPVFSVEAQDISDSDSDWESDAMAGFHGFMWRVQRVNVNNIFIYYKAVIRLSVKKQTKKSLYMY